MCLITYVIMVRVSPHCLNRLKKHLCSFLIGDGYTRSHEPIQTVTKRTEPSSTIETYKGTTFPSSRDELNSMINEMAPSTLSMREELVLRSHILQTGSKESNEHHNKGKRHFLCLSFIIICLLLILLER